MIAIRAVYSFRISWARAVLRSSARSMDDLASSSAATMLQTLQSRHAAELVFTRCGTLMLCLNPHAPLPHLFSREELQRHLHALGRQLPPHIFELGACSDAWHIIIIIMRQSHWRPARAQLTAIIVYAGFSQIQCKSLSVSARVCLRNRCARIGGRSCEFSSRSVRRCKSSRTPPHSARLRCGARGAHARQRLLDLFGSFHAAPPSAPPPGLCTVASTPVAPPPHLPGEHITTAGVVLGPLESVRSCCADPLAADRAEPSTSSTSPPTPTPTPSSKRWTPGSRAGGPASPNGGSSAGGVAGVAGSGPCESGSARCLRAVTGAGASLRTSWRWTWRPNRAICRRPSRASRPPPPRGQPRDGDHWRRERAAGGRVSSRGGSPSWMFGGDAQQQ